MNKTLLSISAFVGAIIIVALIYAGINSSRTLGYSGEQSTKRVDVYGTISATTLASTTSGIIAVGPDYNKVNINIKASSSVAQNIIVYPEFSNESNCDTATTWFRETNNTVSGATVTVSTSTYSLAVGTSLSYNSIVIDEINARCVKLNLSTSSTTVPAILWVEGYFSN
jgi:hypothetical protein